MDRILFSDYKITSPISDNRTVFGVTGAHKGTDYGVPMNTLIQSTTSGEVIATGYDADGFGNYVKVQDASGNTHIYAHLNSVSVNKGDNVSRFSVLGLSGSTGRSTGPHLHYEVKDSSGNVLDGTSFINNDYIDTNIVSGSVVQTGSEKLGFVNNILSTIITFVVMLGIFILAIVSFMKAFDISIPTIPNLKNLAKGE